MCHIMCISNSAVKSTSLFPSVLVNCNSLKKKTVFFRSCKLYLSLYFFGTNQSFKQCSAVHWCLPIRIRRLSRVHCTGHWLTPRPIHCTPLHCTEIYSFQDQRNTPYFITEIHLTLSQKYSLHDLAKTCSGHLLTHHPLLKCTKHDIALHCIEPHNALQSIVKHL